MSLDKPYEDIAACERSINKKTADLEKQIAATNAAYVGFLVGLVSTTIYICVKIYKKAKEVK